MKNPSASFYSKALLLIFSVMIVQTIGWIGPILPDTTADASPVENKRPEQQKIVVSTGEVSIPKQYQRKDQNEESLIFLPQIQEYSIVKEILYPPQRFKIKRSPGNVIKELKEKLAMEQNAIITKSNQNLNKLNTQLSKVVQKQENKAPVASSLDKLKNLPQEVLQSYQRPNKEEDKKKNSLIQQIKKELAQQEQIRKEMKKKEEEKKKQQEEIKKFDEQQKQKLRKQAEQQEKKRIQKQKIDKAREEQIERKRKINHQRFKRQQDMQMKQLQVGFNTGGNMNNKMLELKLKKMAAEKREDQANKKSNQFLERQRKLKMEAEKREDQAIRRNGKIKEQKNTTNIQDPQSKNAMQKIMGVRYQQAVQKIKNDEAEKQKQTSLIQKEENKKEVDKVQNLLLIKKSEQDQIKSKTLENQFEKLVQESKKIKEDNLHRAEEQFMQTPQLKKPQKQTKTRQNQQKSSNLQNNEPKNSASTSQQLISAQSSSSEKTKQKQKSEQIKKSQPTAKQIESKKRKQFKQELMKRIQKYEQQQKQKEILNNSSLRVPQSQKTQQIVAPYITIQQSNLDVDNVQNFKNKSFEVSSQQTNPKIQPKRQKFRQQDTDDQLYEQLQQRRKSLNADKVKERETNEQSKLPQGPSAFSDLFVYLLFGALVLIVIYLRSNSKEQQHLEKVASFSHLYNQGSLIPDEDIDE